MKSNVLNKIELRESISVVNSDDGIKKLVGKIPYNSRSYDLGGFFEVISPTAFNKTLSDNADVKLLFNHDSSKILARVKNNTLILRNTDDGLEFEATLNNTTFANDVYENIRTGNVNTLSFGFNVINDEWRTEEGNEVRILKEVKLIEISAAVAFPSYPNTSSEARGINIEKLGSVLTKEELKEDDYLIIDITIRELEKLIPNKEEENKEAVIEKAGEEPLERDNTLDFLTNLLAEFKK